MTASNNTTSTPVENDQESTKTTWLQDGQKALAVIRALEAGTPGDDTIAYVRTCGDKTMVLGHDGQLWTRTRAPVKPLARLRSETLLRSAGSITSFGRLHGQSSASWQ